MSQSFNKHYQPYQLPQMNIQQRSKKTNKLINDTADIYLQQNSKYRNSGNYVPLKSRNNYDTLKANNRKSIQINTSKNVTLQPAQRSYYKRGQQIFQKQPLSRRYDEQQVRGSSKSPYLKREFQGRNTSLNRSTQKIKSSNFVSRNSNQNNELYKQPRSSLSQHYDPQDTSLHKRRVSMANNDRNYVLEQAKEYYRQNQFQKSIQLLRKYIKFNRTCSQARYLLGMSLINNNQFSLGIQQLLETLEIEPKYKKSLYLVIALAFKKLNKINDAIDILTKGLDHFPDYYDCLVYRGKMYLKGQNYQNAIKDFSRAISINPKKGFAYLGKGTAEKELGMVDQAIETLTQGLKSDMQQACLEKRGTTYFDIKDYSKAIHDFERIKQGVNGTGGSLHYIKGITYYKLKKPIQAILAFEQSLKQDTNQDSVTSSVQMLIRIKIQDKDFYQAYHILNRTNNIEINKQIIDEWRLFLEGTLFMMKKKYKDGITTLKSLLSISLYTTPYEQILIKKNKERYQFLKPLGHLYKAFGQLSEGNVEGAKQDYRQYDILSRKIGSMQSNLSKLYNSLVIQAEEKFPKNCLHLLQQAVKLIPNKPQPHLFLAFERVQNNLEKQPHKKSQNIDYIIECITIAISHLPQLSNNHISTFYFYRAVIYLFKEDFNKAVADVDKAIEKSEDNIPKYFYLRGLIFAIFGNFSQSVQDLSVAISLDEKYAKPYLERAKCLQIEGNSNQAFLDLQKYITLAPEDPYIHKYAGFLLFQNCAYQDCLAAFSHGNDDIIDHQMVLTKAKCHFLLNNTKDCLDLFKKYEQQSVCLDFKRDVQLIKICSSEIKQQAEPQKLKQILKRIQKMIDTVKNEQTECKIFKLRDMHQIRASIYLFLGDYEKSLEEFDKTLHFFRLEKKRELQKQFVEDTQEFEDQWSEVQIKFNISLAYVLMKDYSQAIKILKEFEKSTQRGKNWDQFIELLINLKEGKISCTKSISIDTFEQNHRISKNWPKLKLPGYQVYISLAFSYPFVEPPEMLPQFDDSLFLQFHMNKVEKKPEAPWINRHQKGLVFTPYIQNFQNLELSITTKKQDDDDNQSEKNKPISEIDRSVELSSSQFHLETEALKQRFKLDSLVEMKLRKLMQKKEEAEKK